MFSAEPKAEVDNTNGDFDLIFGISQKIESNNCFIIHCFEEKNDKHTVARNLN